MPDRVKLLATLRHFGLTIDEVEYDHYPALSLRKWSERKRDFVPPQHDPEHVRLLLVSDHRVKTNGPGGERRIHTRGSDVSEPRRIARIGEKHAEFRRRVFGPVKRKPSKPKRPRRTWAKRSFRRPS